jgi:enamine deaminase RidA (YjgF/YER057c/UK114 family)
MGAEARAKELGLSFKDDAEKAYLNMAARIGNTIITSGHTSTQKGKLGDDVTVELLGCVNSTLDFIEQHLVINGASDLLHKIFEGDDGFHARSAIGFAQLPTGVAVEIEAIFEIKS